MDLEESNMDEEEDDTLSVIKLSREDKLCIRAV